MSTPYAGIKKPGLLDRGSRDRRERLGEEVQPTLCILTHLQDSLTADAEFLGD